MATVKIRFRASTVEMREGTLVYQVIHRRVTRQVATGYRLYAQEWDTRYSKVAFPPECTESRRTYLEALQNKVAVDMAMLEDIVAGLAVRAGIMRLTTWSGSTARRREPEDSFPLPEHRSWN